MASRNVSTGQTSSVVPWRYVSSTCWSRWRYLPDARILQFTFRDSGQSYEAYGVPDTIVDFLADTGSIGRTYNVMIKHNYNWRPISTAD